MTVAREGAVVLLSGGQDSTTALFWAMHKFGKVYALSIFYGQRHSKELECAAKVAEIAGVEHSVLHFPALGDIGNSALVDRRIELKATEGLPTSFVPGRNLLLLGLAGAYACKVASKHIVTGVCETDFSGYPDCRQDFVDSMEKSLTLAMRGVGGPFSIHTPLMNLTKCETVRMARHLDIVFSGKVWYALANTLTCYNGVPGGCGKCASCELRAKGFAEAGELDPAIS
jgi:7-cyano-7-deazaguanine synthase